MRISWSTSIVIVAITVFFNDDGGRNNKDMDAYENNSNHDDANVNDKNYNNTTQINFPRSHKSTAL